MSKLNNDELRANTGMTNDEIDNILTLEWDDFYQKVYKNPDIKSTASMSLQQLYTRYKTYSADNPANYERYHLVPCVYLIKAAIGLYKIGYTSNIKNRMSQLRYRLPVAIELIHRIKTDTPELLEKELHRHFSDKNFCDEWFVLDDNDIAYIKSL